jgi:hypothetical protein
LRSGAIAARNLPPAPDSRVRPFGTSDGIAGTVPPGEDGPVAVELVYGIGGTLPSGGVVGWDMMAASSSGRRVTALLGR